MCIHYFVISFPIIFELYQKLDAMPNKLNSVVDKALKECAKPVKEEAKRRARKSKSPTGTSGHDKQVA